MSEEFPSDKSLDEIKIEVMKTFRNPNIGKTYQFDLKSGPKAFRIATIFEILDPKDGSLHHLSLQLDSIDKTKTAWKIKPQNRIRLEGKDPDELTLLRTFLDTTLSEHYPDRSGTYHVVPEESFQLLNALRKSLPSLPGGRKVELVGEIFRSLEASGIGESDLTSVFKDLNQDTTRHIGVVARYLEYEQAFREFQDLAQDARTPESNIQAHLAKYPWLFGSEYSQLLERRTWTRDDNLDFMLRRTIDDYLEIIEIKTPIDNPLFRHDSTHNSYYASSHLSQAVGQVFHYIEEVERNRDSIIASDGFDPLRIQGRIIIGRNHDDEHQAALRTYNSHLHRVEVLTFDQLTRVAERTLAIFKNEIAKSV